VPIDLDVLGELAYQHGRNSITARSKSSVVAAKILMVNAVSWYLLRRKALAGPERYRCQNSSRQCCALAVRDEPRFSVSHSELDREGPSYSVDTLERFAGEDQLFLILGGDALADFGRWHRADRITQPATILVASRPGAPEPAAATRLSVRGSPA